MSEEKREHPPLVRVGERGEEETYSHPFNPGSLIHGVSLSEVAGLQRIGVHFIRVPPGKESFVYHMHHGEEEFLYILSGRGIAEIDGQDHEVGPGDFMGFPTPSVAHHLRNPFDQDLVYLSGGERNPIEVSEMPRNGKRMIRVGQHVSIHPLDGDEGFAPYPKLS